MLNDPEAMALFGTMRTPGGHVVMRTLEQITQQIKEEAFTKDGDATQLIYEARGAARLLQLFKANLQNLEQQAALKPESSDWR